MISVLLPTRMRTAQLRESINSLLLKADYAADIEVLCAIDPDDTESAEMLRKMPTEGRMYSRAAVSAWVAPQRYGYGRLHEYYNFLAGQATGEWLMLWNDDARMETEGWDSVIEAEQPGTVLWMLANHAQGGNLFPVWPQSWYHALGYVSLSPNADVWISEIARQLGVERRIPVQVSHHRPDVTGREADQTHNEGRAVMGPWNDPGYDSFENRAERARAVRVLQFSMQKVS